MSTAQPGIHVDVKGWRSQMRRISREIGGTMQELANEVHRLWMNGLVNTFPPSKHFFSNVPKEKRPKGARKEGAGTRLAEREPGKKSKKAAGPLPGAEAIPWWRSISFERPEKKATKVKVTMNISHRAPKYFVARRRIMVEAAIVDKKYGVKEARLYFRAATEANFVFVPMAAGRSYHAVLPAPSENTEAIDYKILALNNNNVVYTSKDYVIKCKDDRRDGPRAPRDGSPS